MARRRLAPQTLALILIFLAWVFLAAQFVVSYPEIPTNLAWTTATATGALVIYAGYLIYLRIHEFLRTRERG